MIKKFIIYKQSGKLKKAVIDEHMYKVYKANKDITEIEECSDERLMEQIYAEKLGGSNNNKQLLFG